MAPGMQAEENVSLRHVLQQASRCLTHSEGDLPIRKVTFKLLDLRNFDRCAWNIVYQYRYLVTENIAIVR